MARNGNELPKLLETTPENLYSLNLGPILQMIQYKNSALGGTTVTTSSNNSAGQSSTSTSTQGLQQQTAAPNAQVKATFVNATPTAQGITTNGNNNVPLQQIINLQQLPQQFVQTSGSAQQQTHAIPGQNMFQIVQPMQTVTIDGQEAIFIPNLNAAQLATAAQPINFNGQQAFITPNGQIVRAPTAGPPTAMQLQPAPQFIHGLGQAMQLPPGVGSGEQTLFTIPGTNIQVPVVNAAVHQQHILQQQQQQQSQTQSASNASSANVSNSSNTCSTQSSTSTTQVPTSSTQTTTLPSTITIPGTNIQIPTSVAASNGLLGNLSNLLGNNTIKLENGQTLQNVQIRPAGASANSNQAGIPQFIQFPHALQQPTAPTLQQTVAVQVPIQTGGGQTIYQTVHVPIHQLNAAGLPNMMPAQALPMPAALPPTQMQIIPQFAQIAQIVTPNGQIQQVQLAPLNAMSYSQLPPNANIIHIQQPQAQNASTNQQQQQQQQAAAAAAAAQAAQAAASAQHHQQHQQQVYKYQYTNI